VFDLRGAGHAPAGNPLVRPGTAETLKLAAERQSGSQEIMAEVSLVGPSFAAKSPPPASAGRSACQPKNKRDHRSLAAVHPED